MKTYLMLALVCWGLASCSQQTPEQLYAQAEAAAADTTSLDQAVNQLNSFLQRYPQDQLAPKALDKLALIAQKKGDMKGAVELYERLLSQYSKCDQADEAQFMIAFICEEFLGDLDKARQSYQRVIDLYPTSELALSARHLLPNVGRPPEEWVKFQDAPRAP
ncbi:MAG: tetratricopeptide repeat protein [Candidatus Latescibacteria bacterium]|nr:tetratricopeptide repeat protein [Candidatus Latescibacterota bacterium]